MPYIVDGQTQYPKIKTETERQQREIDTLRADLDRLLQARAAAIAAATTLETEALALGAYLDDIAQARRKLAVAQEKQHYSRNEINKLKRQQSRRRKKK